MNGYQAYKLYNALKLHFTTEKYDFFKYAGKAKTTESGYMSRNDRFFFERVAKNYDAKNLEDYFIANLLSNKKWIGDFSEEIYLKHKKVNEALEYTFKRELDILFDNESNPETVFKNTANGYCKLLKHFISGAISLQTMVIINRYIDYVSLFDRKLKDDFIWEQYRFKIVKYTPFLKFDKNKYKEIFLDKIQIKA